MHQLVAQMRGYLAPNDRIENTFLSYLRNNKDVFLIRHLAKLGGFVPHFSVGVCIGAPKSTTPICITYIPYEAPISLEYTMLPFVPKDFHSFSTYAIETFGFANSIDQYLRLAVLSIAGSISKCGVGKMFPNVSYEELLVIADLSFADIDDEEIDDGPNL